MLINIHAHELSAARESLAHLHAAEIVPPKNCGRSYLIVVAFKYATVAMVRKLTKQLL